MRVQWIESCENIVNDSCFEPIPYDDDGIFEKDDHLRIAAQSINDDNDCDSWVSRTRSRSSELSIDELNCSSNSKKVLIPGILKIIIRDTGHGMKPDDLQNLF